MPFLEYKETLLKLGFREDGLKNLEQYVDFLWESNEDLNLVSRKMTYKELMENHVIDCLLPLKYFPKADQLKSFADFGSGGGLPGVLFAIQFPRARALLFEKSLLKQNFLNHCRLFAPNLQVMSEVPSDLEQVDVVISRAFKSAETILQMSQKYFEKGGSYFLFKARRDKLDEDLGLTQKRFKSLRYQLIELKSPVLEVERNILWINPPAEGGA